MRNTMQITMTRVAAITIRATKAVLPGYGDSSCLRNSPNQDREEGVADTLCAAVAIQFSRMVTTADSPTRKSSGVGFSTRTRTGYLDARCTQLSVPMTSGSGVTPNPTLSTMPENRTLDFDST